MTKRDAKDEKKAPKLRFKGFTDDWEQVKLGEIFTECTEKSRDGNEPLLSVTINDGVVKSESLDRKSNASKDKSNYKIVRPNNIAYNSMRMWQGAVGVSNYYGIVSPAYTVISLNETTNSPFFYQYYFKKSSSLNTFRKNSQGLTPDTWNLKYPLFKLIKYRIPQYDEQKKIGQLFQKLDYTINLHEGKQKQLEQLKKVLLQKMFANKSGYPEIRFRGFDEPWEQHKLGHLASLSDIDHKMPKSVKEGIPYIMTNNFTENGIDFKKAKKISQNDYALLSKKSKPQIGDVIIARYASVGETRLVKTDIPFVVSYSCALLRPSSSINNLFFYYSMKSPDVIRSIKINTKTGSQSNIGMEDLKKFVNLPTTDINEQKNIGELLGSIDNIISLNASKVKQLRQLKQALLQQMFI